MRCHPNRCSDDEGRYGVRVLGVDPGLTRCGLGVVEGSVGRPLRLVAVGVVRTSPQDDIGTRLVAVERAVEAWLDEHQPDAVAVERVFSQHNVRTVMGTAQAERSRWSCAARRGIPWPCTPRARSRRRSPATGGPTRPRSRRW